MEQQPTKQELASVDITPEFIRYYIDNDRDFDFYRFLYNQKGKKFKIELDLTGVSDKHQFEQTARKVKACIETDTIYYKIDASIRCTEEQKKWEYNVFASGVKWKKA